MDLQLKAIILVNLETNQSLCTFVMPWGTEKMGGSHLLQTKPGRQGNQYTHLAGVTPFTLF